MWIYVVHRLVDTNWPKNSCGWLQCSQLHVIFESFRSMLHHVMQQNDAKRTSGPYCQSSMQIMSQIHANSMFPFLDCGNSKTTRYLHHTLAQVICHTWSIATPVWVAPGNYRTSSWERRKSAVSSTNLPWLRPWCQWLSSNWDCSLQEVNTYQTNHS